MKKSNVIIFVILALCSFFLLWLWYYLGLNVIDQPLDLVVSIAWWVLIGIAIFAIIKTEQIRRRRVRTVYVSDFSLFNSEKGVMFFDIEKPMNQVIASVLEGLQYDFTREDFPEKEKFDVKYFVRTTEYKREKTEPQKESVPQDSTQEGITIDATASTTQQLDDVIWKGEVVIVESNNVQIFESPEELSQILASLSQKAA